MPSLQASDSTSDHLQPDGPRFLRWIRRSRSDLLIRKTERPAPVTLKSTPLVLSQASANPASQDIMVAPHQMADAAVGSNPMPNGVKGVSKKRSHDHDKAMVHHATGTNRTNLNTLEKLLKRIDNMHDQLNSIFSNDMYADLDPNDPNALDAGLLGDLFSVEGHFEDDIKLVWAVVHQKLFTKGLIDDKNHKVLEGFVKLAASLPSDSALLHKLTNKFVTKLWNQLPHPPMTYLGTRTFAPLEGPRIDTASPAQGIAVQKVTDHKDWVYHQEWRYRSADGSNNSRIHPHLGAAGSPYARTVQPKTILPADMPDAGRIFDEVLAAEANKPRKEHPAGVSSMLFYLATIIIHDCFETKYGDPDTNTTSSYLDLSPLYGKNGEEQKKIRTFRNGLLKKDAFTEVRLLGFPPGVAAFLISFNRFHNYVAGELKEINEGGRFTLPENPTQFDISKHDHDLFQTARLITCGLYVNIVLVDYVRTILNLNRSNSPWRLDPRDNLEVYGPTGVPEGIGNQVSVEFNLLYRWHSAISRRDEAWSESLLQECIDKLPADSEHKGKSPMDLEGADLREIFHSFIIPLSKTDCSTWTLRTDDGELKRKLDGSFDDTALNNLITSSTQDLGGAFGARNVPLCMRAIEMAGINMARGWNVASLNEFRTYFGLAPHDSFESITSDKDVASSLKALYGKPDNVELYPGLVVEDAKEATLPGSGLCPGLTTGQAILSDAVNLVRADRFYTVDFNAAHLTNWGYALVQPDVAVAGGGVMYKLLMKAFPSFYKGNSVYAMYPFTVPEQQMAALERMGMADDFDDSLPRFVAPFMAHITSYHDITKILSNHEDFHVPWGPHIKAITKADIYMLGSDNAHAFAQHKQWIDAMNVHNDFQSLQDIRDLFETITKDLIRERTVKTRTGYQVDAISEIGSMASTIGGAHFFNIMLKTEKHKIGLLNAQQLYTIMSLCFAWTFLDIDETKDFSLHLHTSEAGKALMDLVTKSVEAIGAPDWKISFFKLLPAFRDADDMAKSFGVQLIKKLLAKGKTAREVAQEIIPSMTGMIAPTAQGFAQMLDLYFSEPYYTEHWPKIVELSRSDSDESFQELVGYALEAMRLAPAGFGVFRTAEKDAEVSGCGDSGKETKHVKKGDTIFVNFVTAGRDPGVFQDPEKIITNRPRDKYIHQGWGKHACIGKNITPTAMAAMLRVFARLENVRPAIPLYKNGSAREPSYLKWRRMTGTPFKLFMTPDGSNDWPFPTTMKISFDGFDADVEVLDQDKLFKCDKPDKEENATGWDYRSLLGQYMHGWVDAEIDA